MAPPSQLAIATSSVQRLVKEEQSYHKELLQQEAYLERLLADKDDDENAEYMLKQQRTAMEETKAIFPPLRHRITEALLKLEDQVKAQQDSGADADQVAKAKEVIAMAKASASE